MSKLKDKIKNHPLLDELELLHDPDLAAYQQDSIYKYCVVLIDGYEIAGYGGGIKCAMTLKDVLHYLDTAIKGETPTPPKLTDERRREIYRRLSQLETLNRKAGRR